MLLGLTEPSSGDAEVDGLDPRRDPLAVKRRVGYLPDDVGFYDDVTARENLRYTARLNRMREPEATERIEYLLDQVGLSDVIDRRVRTFSRGMRQRLGLADALIKRPSILILDEPTVNIDPEGVRELLDVRRRPAHATKGMTVLLSSHLLHQVEQVCDRIGIFVSGRLVGLGTVAELAADLHGRLGVRARCRSRTVDRHASAKPSARSAGVARVEVDGPGRWHDQRQPRCARRPDRRLSPRAAARSITSCDAAPTSTRSTTATSSGAPMTATIESTPDARATSAVDATSLLTVD